jgi:hypothetical protein
MIAALILAAAIAQGESVAVTYDQVPMDVERAVAYRWTGRAQPAVLPARVERADGKWSIAATAGTDVVVSLLKRDGSYLLDGPFRWPSSPASRTIDRRARRSVRLDLAAGTPGDAEFEWMPGDGAREAWPACVRDGPGAAVCWGVPLAGAGVVYVPGPGRIAWSVVTDAVAAAMHESAWGRLLAARGGGAAATGLRARLEYPVQPAQRARSMRLQTGSVPRAGAVPVASTAIWVHGHEVPGRAWIEVRAARAGPVYLSLADIAGGLAALPVHVLFDEPRSIEGVVIDQSTKPAAGALVTVFRLLEPVPPARPQTDAEPVSRVFVAEVIADRAGAFTFDGLGAADYEIVAFHPQGGRASMPLDARTRVEIRLENAGTIRGRVLSGGKPAAGADVIGVPDPSLARVARDVVDLTGGNVRTGADGRFEVSAAAAGGGELRIGGGLYPIRRIPLPRDTVRVLDLGDIELGAAISITASLDGDPGCDLRAAGPIGRTGLMLVAGVRVGAGLYRIDIPEEGAWEFTLSCGGAERALSPAVRQITSALAGKEVQFAVR